VRPPGRAGRQPSAAGGAACHVPVHSAGAGGWQERADACRRAHVRHARDRHQRDGKVGGRDVGGWDVGAPHVGRPGARHPRRRSDAGTIPKLAARTRPTLTRGPGKRTPAAKRVVPARAVTRGGRAVPPPERVVKIKSLDPFVRCGPGTSVEQLYRVDERVDGRATVHLVFFDQYGWYCVHGRGCGAVADVHQELRAQRRSVPASPPRRAPPGADARVALPSATRAARRPLTSIGWMRAA
jgi:hypothetical protein